MLLLGRRQGEAIVITTPQGDTIEVVVMELRRDQVRLGFNADEAIRIHRREVYDAIERRKECTDSPSSATTSPAGTAPSTEPS